MIAMLMLVAGLLILLCNLGVLSVIVKIYTEILKIGHIKNIGKAA